MKHLLAYENLNNSPIEEVDTKGYVSSSDFRQDFPLYFGKRLSGGYKIEGGHCLSFWKPQNNVGVIALADSEGWTVGYNHPRGYGKLFGVWYIKNATEIDIENLEEELEPLIRIKKQAYNEKERSLFPKWKDLSREEKHELRKQMINSGHLPRRSTLEEAGSEYSRYISFWGQSVVKNAKMEWR